MPHVIGALLLAVSLAVPVLSAPAALGQDRPTVRPTITDRDAEISIYDRRTAPGSNTNGVDGARTRRRAWSLDCELRELGSGGTDPGGGFNYGDRPVTDFTVPRNVFRICVDRLTGEPGTNGMGGVDVVAIGPGADPTALLPALTGFDIAELALARLPIAVPAPHLNPATREIVHLPTWLWVDDQGTPTTSVSLAGVTATLTAHLAEVVWEMGDGTSVRCDGPGTPYDTARPADAQHPTCSRIPGTRIGKFTVTVTTRWRVEFIATDGTGGGLGMLTRTSTLPTEVVELQTVVRDG